MPTGAFLEASSDIASDPVKKGSKAAWSFTVGTFEDPALAKALDEDFLDCVVEVRRAR